MAVIWLAEAWADLARIFEFNCERSDSYASRVERRLIERASALSNLPFQGPPLGSSGLRTLSIPDIQYVLLYGVDLADVLIFRVYSTREDWRGSAGSQ